MVADYRQHVGTKFYKCFAGNTYHPCPVCDAYKQREKRSAVVLQWSRRVNDIV